MINKLVEKIKKTNAPIVVGLDPMLNYIPEHIQKAAFAKYGETLEGAAEAMWQFNKGIVDATCDLIPAVKPQIAMYEQFGIEGLKVFKKTVDDRIDTMNGQLQLLIQRKNSNMENAEAARKALYEKLEIAKGINDDLKVLSE